MWFTENAKDAWDVLTWDKKAVSSDKQNTPTNIDSKNTKKWPKKWPRKWPKKWIQKPKKNLDAKKDTLDEINKLQIELLKEKIKKVPVKSILDITDEFWEWYINQTTYDRLSLFCNMTIDKSSSPSILIISLKDWVSSDFNIILPPNWEATKSLKLWNINKIRFSSWIMWTFWEVKTYWNSDFTLAITWNNWEVEDSFSIKEIPQSKWEPSYTLVPNNDIIFLNPEIKSNIPKINNDKYIPPSKYLNPDTWKSLN